MTKLIVSVYSSLIEAVLILLLLIGAAIGYHFIPDSSFSHSQDLYEHKEAIKIATSLIGTFMLEVIIFGPILVLSEILIVD